MCVVDRRRDRDTRRFVVIAGSIFAVCAVCMHLLSCLRAFTVARPVLRPPPRRPVGLGPQRRKHPLPFLLPIAVPLDVCNAYVMFVIVRGNGIT